ncbi:MAG: hypothetical protein ACR2L6_01125 [Gemmatimonadaceae bacterium]
MTLARLAVSPAGYEIQTSPDVLRLTVAQHGRVFELGFAGSWRAARKGKLIKRLLAKQFDPVIPRLRIRLSRTR